MSEFQKRQPEKVCSLCDDFIAAGVLEANGFMSWKHKHRSYEQWGISAHRGCPLCRGVILAAAARSIYKGPLCCTIFPDPMGVERHVYIEDDIDRMLIGLRPVSATEASLEGLENTTGSAKSLKFAKDSLEHCLTAHGHSKFASKTKSSTPTRLIELGKNGCRLHLTAQSGETPAYTTLSHCWGSVEQQSSMFKLSKHNLNDLCQEIPMTKLCKAFKEAIEVTESLGYKYLWIDSLCIIQDDKADWLRESSLMSDVYGGSVVTIAATGAKDGSEGLFFQRDGKSHDRQFCRTSTGQVWDIQSPEIDLAATYFSGAPLAKRGWVFQERFLAQRTIHFTSQQIFMECYEGKTCEAWPNGLPKKSGFIELIPFPKDTRMEDWEKVVLFYSTLKLTYPEDKLVALSGVAQQFFARHGQRYCAGLWWGDIERQLLWTWIGPRIRPFFPDRAPSWSWAVCDGEVELVRPLDNWLFSRAIQFNCHPVGTDPFGQIRDAQLLLVCFPLVREMTIHGLLKRSREFYSLSNRDEWFSIDRREDWGSCDDVYYLFIAGGDDPFGHPKSTVLSGLLVKKAEGKGKGKFSRVGLFRHWFYHSTLQELRKLQIANSDGCLDESFYEEDCGEEHEMKRSWGRGMKQYLITLV